MIYHVFVDIHVDGEPAILVLDSEPAEWVDRVKYTVYGRTYYVYSHGAWKASLLIEIGRAIERRENPQP